MTTLAAGLAALALAAPAGAPWSSRGQVEGISIYNRSVPGSSIKEVKAEGLIDSPPPAVWAVLRDITAYPKTMPYTRLTTILGEEGGGNVIYYYTALDLPIVKDRDYTLKITLDHTPADGSGIYRISWVAANDYPKAPPPLSHYVRLTEVSGYWELTPQEGGKATHAVYYVHTDPASALPSFITNKANTDAVPKLWRAVREWAKKPPYVSAK